MRTGKTKEEEKDKKGDVYVRNNLQARRKRRKEKSRLREESHYLKNSVRNFYVLERVTKSNREEGGGK